MKKLKHLGLGTKEPYLTDAGMASIAGLHELVRLYAGSPHLTDKTLSYLSDMKKLELLRVRGNFTDQGLQHLDGLENLTTVWIDSMEPLSKTSIAQLKRNLPNVYHVDIK